MSIGALFVAGCVAAWGMSSAPSSNDGKSLSLDVLVLAKQPNVSRQIVDAVKMTREMTANLQNNLEHVHKATHKALKQIDEWAKNQAAMNNDELRNYTRRMALAAAQLTNVETDFKTWCFTQGSLFNAFLILIRQKLDTTRIGDMIDVTHEYELLNRTVSKGLSGVKGMMHKIVKSQSEFSELGAEADSMLEEIKQQQIELHDQKSESYVALVAAGAACAVGGGVAIVAAHLTLGASILATGAIVSGCEAAMYGGEFSVDALCQGWEKSFSEQVLSAQALGNKSSYLADRAQEDYKKMSDVAGEMDTVEVLNADDAEILKLVVVPAVEDLVKFLHSSSQQEYLALSAA